MAIYFGAQKVAVSGIGKVYVGNQKVYEHQTGPVAGLYDANDNLIATYAESGLRADADYTLETYKTELGSGYCTLQRYPTCKKIILPNSITRIGDRAFCVCEGLTSVTISNSVESIGSNAFYKCTSLTDIYCGFAEGAIAGAPWGATNATVHYNYTSS